MSDPSTNTQTFVSQSVRSTDKHPMLVSQSVRSTNRHPEDCFSICQTYQLTPNRSFLTLSINRQTREDRFSICQIHRQTRRSFVNLSDASVITKRQGTAGKKQFHKLFRASCDRACDEPDSDSRPHSITHCTSAEVLL